MSHFWKHLHNQAKLKSEAKKSGPLFSWKANTRPVTNLWTPIAQTQLSDKLFAQM